MKRVNFFLVWGILSGLIAIKLFLFSGYIVCESKIKKLYPPVEEPDLSGLWYQSFLTVGLQKERIEPCYPFVPHCFTLDELAPHQGEGVIIASLEVPFAQNNGGVSSAYAHHSAHAWGVIKGTPYSKGIAEKCILNFLEVFDEAGVAPLQKVEQTISSLAIQKADVAVMGFKIDISFSALPFMDVNFAFSPLTLVVAAAGNDAQKIPLPMIAFPACLPFISLDVGSFGVLNNLAFISSFSQYQLYQGPRVVAPGENILSSWAFLDKATPVITCYGVASGTSIAAYVIAGFMALLKGEFKNHFSKEQLLIICYAATLKLHNRSDWQEKVLFGTIDFRMALYLGHVLLNIKNSSPAYANIFLPSGGKYQDFTKLALVVRAVLLRPTEEYSTLLELPSSSFSDETLTYKVRAEEKKEVWAHHKNRFRIPQNISEAIEATTSYCLRNYQRDEYSFYETDLEVLITTTLGNS